MIKQKTKNKKQKITPRALADPYPDAKREACTAVELTARHAPTQLRLHQATLLKPLLGNLGHQHARIRTVALQVRPSIELLPWGCMHTTRTTIPDDKTPAL
jgi:hypothetical protein